MLLYSTSRGHVFHGPMSKRESPERKAMLLAEDILEEIWIKER